jgi:hypothetical protein
MLCNGCGGLIQGGRKPYPWKKTTEYKKCIISHSTPYEYGEYSGINNHEKQRT